MSDWREITADQNLRLAQQMLSQAGEINDLKKQLRQAEAAIERVRALLEPAPDGAVFAVLRGGDGQEWWQAVIPREDLEAALGQPAQQGGDDG